VSIPCAIPATSPCVLTFIINLGCRLINGGTTELSSVKFFTLYPAALACHGRQFYGNLDLGVEGAGGELDFQGLKYLCKAWGHMGEEHLRQTEKVPPWLPKVQTDCKPETSGLWCTDSSREEHWNSGSSSWAPVFLLVTLTSYVHQRPWGPPSPSGPRVDKAPVFWTGGLFVQKMK
jgi:hypothetical protein